MRRVELLRLIKSRAKALGLDDVHVRQGRDEVRRCGDVQYLLPRHREINDGTAFRIVEHLETALGKEWWRS